MRTVRKNAFPTLAGMEDFVKKNSIILPTKELHTAMDSVIAYRHRDFLNANIHNPGKICVTGDSLSGIAQGGMFTLIQESINLL